MEDWTELRYKSGAELKRDFSEDTSIGLLLGEVSGGLIDIDLDSEEARILAESFLPHTEMKHGRESSPASHYWYILKDKNARGEVKTTKFHDPTMGRKAGSGLVEIRSNGGQTLIPPSVHPSGETYEWHNNEWSKPLLIDGPRLIKQVKWLAAASLLTRHWPGSGGRHEAALALAGGLCRINDPELQEDAWKFVYLVAGAAGDEEIEDRVTAVETTIKAIRKGKNVRGWPSLKQFVPESVIDDVIKWLTPDSEDDDSDDDYSMRREPLLIGIDVEAHPQLVPDLLYEGRLTWWQGEPGGGKTLLMLFFLKEMARNGHRVMLVDEESGNKMTSERLTLMQADPIAVAENFFYYPFPGINAMDIDSLTEFFKCVSQDKPNLVVFDSAADLYATAGLREDSNDDTNVLYRKLIQPLTKENIAVVVIDHVTKSKETREGWARGAGSKKSKSDAAWTVTTVKEFSRNQMGRISLKRSKDRIGELPNSMQFNIGGRKGITVVERADIIRDLSKTKDVFVERIYEYLRLNAATEEDAVPVRVLLKEVSGGRNKLSETLQAIEANIGETPLEVIVRGNSKLWFYAGDLEVDFDAEV